MHTDATRESRQARDPMQPFDALDRTHRLVLEELQRLEALVVRLADHGVDADAQAMAGAIVRFFSSHAREHHADEERLVFPSLLSSGDEQLRTHVVRLQQDHGWLEEDWLELSPQLEAVSQGYNWYDLEMLRHALPVFTALYREHIALEESMIYPEARRRHQALREAEAARTLQA